MYWLTYRCESGHSWTVFVDSGEPPEPLCPHGHEAVTLRRDELADRVRVAIIPATRVDDSLTGHVVGEGEFLLEIQRHDGSMIARSSSTLSWEQAVSTADAFRGATEAEAVQRWGRLGLNGSRAARS